MPVSVIFMASDSTFPSSSPASCPGIGIASDSDGCQRDIIPSMRAVVMNFGFFIDGMRRGESVAEGATKYRYPMQN